MPNAPQRHQPHGARPRDSRRFTATDRGYTNDWQREKKAALERMIADEADPFCRYCRVKSATTIDHAIPVTRLAAPGTQEYERRFRDQRYWIPCCIGCNSKKQDMMPDELMKREPVMHKRLTAVLAARGVTL